MLLYQKRTIIRGFFIYKAARGPQGPFAAENLRSGLRGVSVGLAADKRIELDDLAELLK